MAESRRKDSQMNPQNEKFSQTLSRNRMAAGMLRMRLIRGTRNQYAAMQSRLETVVSRLVQSFQASALNSRLHPMNTHSQDLCRAQA